jgi:hypothetical protein
MQIKNTSAAVRSVSIGGKDQPLTPGAFVEVPLTDDEAEAFRGLGFAVTGEPVKAAVTERKSRAAE